MIPVRSDVRVWLAGGHTDTRKGMGGFALRVQKGRGEIHLPGTCSCFGGQWVADQDAVA